MIIVNNIFLCQIYELNFIICMYVWEKTEHTGFHIICNFRYSLGVLEISPCGWGGWVTVIKILGVGTNVWCRNICNQGQKSVFLHSNDECPRRSQVQLEQAGVDDLWVSDTSMWLQDTLKDDRSYTILLFWWWSNCCEHLTGGLVDPITSTFDRKLSYSLWGTLIWLSGTIRTRNNLWDFSKHKGIYPRRHDFSFFSFLF